MIETRSEISNEDGYIKYNNYEISDLLKDLIADDYLQYNTKDFKKASYCELMYKKNFYDKYDRVTHKEVYEKYIDDEAFKQRVLFVYAVIDYDKYSTFVEKNEEIENSNEYSLTYSILDSDGTKVNKYNLTIADIAFVF